MESGRNDENNSGLDGELEKSGNRSRGTSGSDPVSAESHGSGGGAFGSSDGRGGDPVTGGGGRRNKRNTDEKPFELAILEEVDKKETSKKRKKKKEASPVIEENFKHLLIGIFTITGNINPIWQVQESEIELVVAPATRIFERYVTAKAEETSDIISLVIALTILLVPRVILTVTAKKEGVKEVDKKGEVRAGNQGSLPKFADAFAGSNDIIT